MRKIFLYPLIIVGLVIAIPTIAFEEKSSKLDIKYELNAVLDELVLSYCKTYDSYTINKLYSEKDILKNDFLNKLQKKKFLVNIKTKPLNPKSYSVIKNNSRVNLVTNLSEKDFQHLNEQKQQFVKTVLPLIINENQKILSNRNDLIVLRAKLTEKNSLNNYELNKLRKLSKKYKIEFDNEHKMEIIDKLLLRVEMIPNSIVLAQAAIESGWGSSRFAQEYNALFGEYTYDNTKGVVPLERENGDTHLIKAFNSYNNSVVSYFNNINSHYAYENFREIRSIMRERNNFSNVYLLIERLSTYAEDENYIKTIKQVIKTNNFSIFDQKIISY